MGEPKTINDILQANPEPAVPTPRERPHHLGKLKADGASHGGPKAKESKPDVKGCEKTYGKGHPMCGSP